MLIIINGCAFFEDNCGNFPVFAQDLLRSPAVHQFDAVFQRFRNFILCRRHLIPLFQAEHGDFIRTGTQCGTGDVNGHIAAAHYNSLTLQTNSVIPVDAAQEIHTSLNTLRIFTGNTGEPAALHSDSDIEAFVTLLAQLLNGNIFPDFHTAFDLDTHLADHIDFRVEDIFFQPVARDAVDEHTAGFFFFFKNGHRVAVLPQEIGGRQSGRTGTDHGNFEFVPPHAAVMLFAQRYVAFILLQFEGGDELFDLVDGQRLVDGAAGAGIFTAAVADRTADHREWIVLFDELQRFVIAPFRCHLDIPLHGKMYRAGGLAGSGTTVITVDLRVIAIVVIPFLRAPRHIIRQFRLRIGHRTAILTAELLSQFRRTHRADLHALAAGHTFVFVHMGTVCGSGHVRRIEKLGRTDRITDTRCTVADRDDFIFPVNIGNLMDVPMAFGSFQNFVDFFF